MKTIVAVDPGVSGGVAVWHAEGIELYAMPATLTELRDLLLISKFADSQLWIEEVPKFAGRNIPSSTTAVLFRNLGQCEGLAVALGYALNRVRPVDWQEPLGLGGRRSCDSQDRWKRKLKNKACELYPHLDVTLKTADALLILRYGMNNQMK